MRNSIIPNTRVPCGGAQVLRECSLRPHRTGGHTTRGKPEKSFKWLRPGQELGSRRLLTLKEAMRYANKLKRKKHASEILR